MDNSQWPWLLVLVVIFIARGVIAYARARNRQRTPAERAATEAGTRKIYREEEKRPDGD